MLVHQPPEDPDCLGQHGYRIGAEAVIRALHQLGRQEAEVGVRIIGGQWPSLGNRLGHNVTSLCRLPLLDQAHGALRSGGDEDGCHGNGIAERFPAKYTVNGSAWLAGGGARCSSAAMATAS